MTTESENPTLSELVDFTWYRALTAAWVPAGPIDSTFNTAWFEFWRDNHPDVDLKGPDGVWMRAEWTRSRATAYEPLRDAPTLFRVFADLEKEGFREFAQRYGVLKATAPGADSSLTFWEYEAQTVRAAVRLWESLKAGRIVEDFDDLVESRSVQWITIDDAGVEHLFTQTEGELKRELPDEDAFEWPLETETLPNWPEGSSRRAMAQDVLRGAITDALTRHEVTPTVVPDGRIYGAGLRLTFHVTSLIGAIWLQLALAVDGNRDYRKCPVCGEWWDATDARSHKKVCSDKCRAKKSYQERQKAKSQMEGKEGLE